MLLRLLAPVWLCILLAMVACGDDDVDAGHDAGRDGGRDAGRDGGTVHPDAGRDAGRDGGPGDPDWAPMPGLPDYCVVERALHPETLYTPEWESCGEGCEQLAAPAADWLRVYDVVGSHDDSRGYFVPIEGRRTDERRITLIAATDGSILAGWREPLFDGTHLCLVSPVGLSATSAAMIIRTDDEERIYHAPLASIGGDTEPEALLDGTWLRGGGSSTQHLAVSDTTVAAEVQPAGYVAVADDGVLGALADGADAAIGSPQDVQVLGHSVFWEDYAGVVRFDTGALGVPGEIYVDDASADIRGPRVDGTWVAWQRAMPVDGPPYTSVELWASPYAENASDLVPRRVSSLAAFSDSSMGAGIYAYLPDAYHIELYDLANGRRRTFTMPPSSRADAAPLYVTRDEMLIPGRVLGALPSGPLFTLFRVQLASLPYE